MCVRVVAEFFSHESSGQQGGNQPNKLLDESTRVRSNNGVCDNVKALERSQTAGSTAKLLTLNIPTHSVPSLCGPGHF